MIKFILLFLIKKNYLISIIKWRGLSEKARRLSTRRPGYIYTKH